MSSLPCNIVLLPSDEIAHNAISLSEALRQYDTYFTLKGGSYFPHASLYMTQLKEDDLNKVMNILQEIAHGTTSLTVTASKFKQAHGYISLSYSRTAALDSIQSRVVDAINPIRDGLRRKDIERLATATGMERTNLEQYGYRSVGELFDPHITFTRLKSSEFVDSSCLENEQQFNGSFTKLGLFEMGDNGTCVRKIAEFNLGEI